MVALLIVVIIGPGIMMKYYESKTAEDLSWQENEQQTITNYKESLTNEELTVEDKKNISKSKLPLLNIV